MILKEASGSSRGGRPRSLQSKQALFEAALTLLATEGFDAMSIEAIAERANVGKQTIYRWWPSKEALVIDAVKHTQLTYNPVIETGSLRQDLIAMLTNVTQMVSGPHARGLLIHALAMMTNHTEVYQIFYDQIVTPRLGQIEQVIQRAQGRGEIRQDIDANEIIGLLAGPSWYHLFLNASGLPLTPDLAERIVDTVLHGLAVPGQ